MADDAEDRIGPFRSMKIGRKLWLIIFLLIIPIAALLALLISEKNIGIDFARKELHGSSYLRSLSKLMQYVPIQRRLMHFALAGAASEGGERIDSNRSLIDKAFDGLDATDGKLGYELGTTESMRALKRRWEALNAKHTDMPQHENDSGYAELISEIQALIVAVGNSSNLILDPDLDSFYVMDVALQKMPNAQKIMAQIEFIGCDIIAKGDIAREDRNQLTILSGLLGANMNDIQSDMALAFTNNSAGTLRARIDGKLQETVKAARLLQDTVERRMVVGQRVDVDGAEFLAITQGAISKSLELWTQSMDELDVLLKSRIEGFKHREFIAILGAAGIVFACILLSMSIIRGITRPIEKLMAAINAISEGNFKEKLPVKSGDEIGQLAVSFNTMTEELERHRDYLEELVAERTAELSKANARLKQEIAERKHAQEDILSLNADLDRRVHERTAQLGAANQELEAFAYSVSHDLRAPLRHIDGFLDLFQKGMAGALDERSQHYMTTISDSTRRMGTLIDDLLSFSRMGRYEMSKMQIDLGALVQEVIREFEPETGGRAIRWHVADLPVVIGDHAMLRIVLVNLISNALKFTLPRKQAEIEIGCTPGETETIVFIRDNGVGFDMNYADKLFGVFQRLHRADEFEGIGIGLANVRRIINRHGGRTWAEGKVDHGATFYFSLP